MSDGLTRRDVLVGGGVGLAGLILAACGSNTATSSLSRSTIGSTLAGTGTTAGASPGTTGAASRAVTLDAATVAKLDQLLAAGMQKTGLPGIDIGVWIGAQEWRRQAGVADLETKAPYPADANARIASITKTFTGTAVLQLVDQKKLTLDDKLETYITGIANGDKITVRNLLSMTSGIFDFTSDPDFVAKFDADPTMAWTEDDTLAIIRAHPADFEPGAKVVYCDSNFVLLGLIAAKLTNQTTAQAINTQVIDELGLKSTTYPTTAVMPAPHPTAYFPDVPADATKPITFDNAARPPRVANDVNPAVAAGAGAIVSTVLDLKAWGRELTDGALLTPETQRQRLQTQLLSGQNVASYGLGILQIGNLYGHTGAVIGYNSAVLRYPEADATFVAVSNESTNFTTPATDILTAIIQTLYPEALK